MAEEFLSNMVRCGSSEMTCATNDDRIPNMGAEVKSQKMECFTQYKSAGNGIATGTINGQKAPNYNPNLPSELNIFSNLTDSIYQYKEAGDFLRDFEKVLVQKYQGSELEDISLPKLRIGEQSSTDVVIDWIFNYFQMYFSFDGYDGNYWGTIVANDEEGKFINNVIKIRPENRREQICAILDTVLMLLR